MSSSRHASGASGPSHGDFEAWQRYLKDGLDGLETRMDQVLSAGLVEVDAVLEDLQNAHEELRVADEEINSQREELQRLLRAQQQQSWLEERLISALPAAILVTDAYGRVVRANSALAAMLGTPIAYLQGKPIQAFVAQHDRRQVRQVLSEAARESGRATAAISLTPRHGRPIPVQLVGHCRAASPSDGRQIDWVVIASSPADPDSVTVADAFTRLVELPLKSQEPSTLLSGMARVCARALGLGVSASISIGPPATPISLGSSDQVAQQVDGAMLAADEGPSQDSWEQRTVVESGQLGSDPRWPRLSGLSREVAVASTLAVPVEIGGELFGVLTAYSPRTDDFDRESAELTHCLATAIAALLHEAKERREMNALAKRLEQALESRPMIDQAKGILMVQNRCGADQAFAMLVTLSRNHNVKLRKVAEQIVRRHNATAASPAVRLGAMSTDH